MWSYGRFEDTPAAVFRQIVDTTLFGQIHGARAVLPHFRSQGYGVLVNVGSPYGRLSSPYVSPYVTSKWGLLGFSEVLRQELRDAPNIAVCSILPGALNTPIYRHAANYIGRDIRPLPLVVSPDRVAAAILRAVDRPKAQIIVGQTQHFGVWAHFFVPRLYDRLVGHVVRIGALEGTPTGAHDGNVFIPGPGDQRRRRWMAETRPSAHPTHPQQALPVRQQRPGRSPWLVTRVRYAGTRPDRFGRSHPAQATALAVNIECNKACTPTRTVRPTQRRHRSPRPLKRDG